jgi:ankyrin repeat protein
VNVTENINERVSHISLPRIIDDTQMATYFESQGGEILHKKVLQLKPERHPVLVFLKKLLRLLITPKDPDTERLHGRLAARICHAMMALDPRALKARLMDVKTSIVLDRTSATLKAAVAASIGNVAMMHRNVHKLDCLCDNGGVSFPNALSAAVASNRIKALQQQLVYISDAIKDMPKARNWKPMRNTAKYIGKALTVAIRLHRNVAANILFDFFDSNEALKKSRPLMLGEWLFKDAIRNTNKALLYRILDLDLTAKVVETASGPQPRYDLERDYLEFLLKFDKGSVLTMLLQDGHIDPNQDFGGTTLVASALAFRRRHLAHILLENGADVNGLTRRDGVTALWHAVEESYHWDVLFLLRHGADPDFPKDPKKSPFHRTKGSRLIKGKTIWLLKLAMSEDDRAYVKNSEGSNIWALYDFDKFDCY